MATKVGRLNVLLTAGSAGFGRGLARASKLVDRFRSRTTRAFKSIGKTLTSTYGRLTALASAAGFVGFGVAFKRSADAIDNVAKTSRKLLGNTGATGALRGIRLAANEAGVSTENLDSSFERFLDTMGSAKSGNKAAQKIFKDVGVSMAELRRSTPEELFLRVGDAIRDLPDADRKMSAIRDLFGRAGGGLVNLFNQGSGAIRQAQADIERFGLALTAVAANKVEQMNDSFGRSRMLLSGLMEQLVVRLAPALTAISERFIGWIDRIGGAGKAVDNFYTFVIDNAASVLDTIEGFEMGWLRVKKSILGATGAALKYIGNIGRHSTKYQQEQELEKRAAMIAPAKREEFKRRARAAGGFGDERVTLDRVGEALQAQGGDVDAELAAIEKRRKEKGSLGSRFKEFIFESDETATKKALDFQEQLTDQFRKRVDLQRELNREQTAGLDTGFVAFRGPTFDAAAAAAATGAERVSGQAAGSSGGTLETNRLLRNIDGKLGAGVPTVYA